MKAGDRIPTEKELMERFQVSKITIVNALTGLANEKIITRVPGRGSFVSDADHQPESAKPSPLSLIDKTKGAEDLLNIRTDFIGIIMPSIEDYFGIRLIEGIQHKLRNKGYRSMILLSEGSVEKEKEAIKTLKKVGVEGLLIFPVDEEKYNEEILSMKLSNFPFVLIDRFLPGVETNYIASDGRLGTAMAVEHLWELGHREIAICSDSPLQTVTVQERIEGYMNALKNKGALINPAHMITDFRLGNLKETETHPLYRYIRNRMATAYISLNGKLGVQIYRMAESAGLHVPKDLSIVSFDDPTSVVEDFSIFTHIKQFEHEIGYRAADTLVNIINGGSEGQNGKYSKILLEPELIVCKTSGPNPELTPKGK
jgi:GntR family transcriptional regulator of arabinose operon